MRANDFFRGHREKCPGFDGGIVGDEHEEPAANSCKTGDGSCGGRAAPFFVHFERGEEAEFEKVRVWVDEFRDAFTGGQAAFFVLRVDRFCAAALADEFFLILHFREEFDDVAGILLKVFRVAINGGFQNRSGHAAPSQRNDNRDSVYKKEQERFATEAQRH